MKTWVLLLLLFHVVYCEQKLVPTATTHVITTLINYEDEKGTHRYSKVVATETVYTTVVETASPIVIHSIYDAGSAGQQQQQSDSAATTSSATTASSDEIKSEDNQNQSAIKRMIMILSLVGGLGVIAIVATAVIFTRIRAKNKRKREEALVHEDSIIEQDIAPSAPPPPAATPATPATPATATITTPPALMAVTPIQGRHISISHVAPSAPTAKELDGVVDDHDEGCSRFIVPEGPPPAYTPSAPPHYALDSLIMLKIILFYLVVLFALSVEAGSYHRRSPLERRDECDISCTNGLEGCSGRCAKHTDIQRQLITVCQGGQCYCGFEIGRDS